MAHDMVLDDIVVWVGGRHVYTLAPFRDGFFAMYRGPKVDATQFVGYFPEEVLTDSSALQTHHSSVGFSPGYWTYSRCRRMAQALGHDPEGPIWAQPS